ncbi:MAG: TonB-dependent receptor [Bacteroidales bacterium]|nr:TonB-dependent receptor [Bacteroidales bacterium]MCF8405596.1 TonB-dependent receptor [Bacteroidales bacterium]
MRIREIKILWFVLGLCLIYNIAESQNSIQGIIRDGRTNQALEGANIYFPDLKTGTTSGAYGFFEYKIPKPTQSYTARISYMGYADTILDLQPDTSPLKIFLFPDSVKMASIVVTATRTRKALESIPQRMAIIDSKTIQNYPASNTDDLLRMVPGVNVNRSWGIYSRNSSVTMRGMPGSARSLILLDGVPLNKTAGGTVSWHLVTPEEIERIEIVNGPVSTVYGNNAMGGVINLITKKPDEKFKGFIDLGYGTYNTLKAQWNVSSQISSKPRGLYWKVGSFYRVGDGYILEPEESRDSTIVKAFLNETNVNALVGYKFSKNSKIELDYRYYKDFRGSGIKVFEEYGNYESFRNNNISANWEGLSGKYNFNVRTFYFNENFYHQNEKVNSSGEYRLSDTKTSKDDVGLWFTFSRNFGTNSITAGIDAKYGNLDNNELYLTSTDDIYTQGNLFFAALFIQDEYALPGEKLFLNAGIRTEHALFYRGSLRVNNPTNDTGFTGDIDEKYSSETWVEISPKVGLKYNLIPALSVYINASSGFMPPKLDDLAGSRKIRRGFKLANPNLVPEKIKSIELGLDWSFQEKFFVKPTAFYSGGTDFQYLVATGDFIDKDAEDPIPVYQRQNISKVEVSGFELGLRYILNKAIKCTASYTYNNTKILEYSSTDNVDLTGKELNEVPANLLYTGISWTSKICNFYLDYTFTDDQWFDEENTEMIKKYSIINMRISKKVHNDFLLSLDIRDLLDEQFIDRKGYLSPGRFIMLNLKYIFSINNKN